MPPVERSTSSSSVKKEIDGRKQASLFSFFQKKEKSDTPFPPPRPTPSPASKSVTPLAKNMSCTKINSITSDMSGITTTPSTSIVNKGGSADGSASRVPAASTYGKEVVGKRVKVWWPEDEEYYGGTITAFSGGGDGKHAILYDDGEEERVYLARETIQWEDSECLPSAETSIEQKRGQAAHAVTQEDSVTNEVARKRRVVQDESESEDEINFSSATPVGVAPYPSFPSSLKEFSGKRARLELPALSNGEGEDNNAESKGRRDRSARTAFAGLGLGNDSFAPSEPASAPRANEGSSDSQIKGTPASASNSTVFNTPLSASSGRARLSLGSSGGGSVKKGRASWVEEEEDEVVAASHDRPDGVLEYGKHTHHGLKWLWDPHRRDAQGRSPQHPDFDRRTLQVPAAFLAKETPAMRQWWEFKAQHLDTILFFKVGKFYEIFHMDADVAVRELELIYMKGEKAHSGFPEIAYGKFAPLLVEKGYRVARIEQVETPEAMKEHNRRCGPGAKRTVVARELCSVLSRGTRTFCYLDEATFEEGAGSDPTGAPLLIAIKQEKVEAEASREGEDEGRVAYGVCMVDPTTATFHLGQFEDGPQRWRLKTMLSQFSPAEILLERGGACASLEQVVRLCAPGALVEMLRPGAEFWDADKAFKELKKGDYFPRGSKKKGKTKGDGEAEGESEEGEGLMNGCGRWPLTLQVVAAARRDKARLALCALGGVIWQLRRSLIDKDLLSMQSFYPYAPPDVVLRDAAAPMPEETEGLEPGSEEEDIFFCLGGDEALLLDMKKREEGLQRETLGESGRQGGVERKSDHGRYLVLDGTALTNLEIFRNSYDGTGKGTLWEHLNHCRTAFGARKLREMLCRPSQRPGVINARLDAVTELKDELSPEADEIRRLLKKMPDLERQLARHHALGSVHRAEDHPDSRAIMYELDKYNGRKINDFLSTLEGLKTASKVRTILFDSMDRCHSTLLQRLTMTFPDLGPRLDFFGEAFDPAQAKREGVITPKPGYDDEYDSAKERIEAVMAEIEMYLKEQRQRLGSQEIKYWGSKDKDRFQLEVPEAILRRGQPADYEAKSSKKGCRRFHTPRIRELLEELGDAEASLSEAQRQEMRRLFENFDHDRQLWTTAVNSLALLDVLLALAEVSSGANYCRPTLVPYHADSTEEAGGSNGAIPAPFLSIKGGRHPCLETRAALGDYIPNDIELGVATGQRERVMLLSGPNMGGKSTLLRQTCVLAILAQLGCYVPAEECSLTPVDRIFTRVGASDRILQGQSTFFVELAETANILQHATSRSLVILDELGRGTSTFDGTAIAHAVVSFLVQRLQCRALFATHYHSLVEDWRGHVGVCFGHMACLVEPDEAEQKVTFLYRLADGPSPKSYGLNVARLAHLPSEVIDLAREKSETFEAFMTQQGHEGSGNKGKGTKVHLQLWLGAEIFALLTESPSSMTVDEKAKTARALWTEWNAQ